MNDEMQRQLMWLSEVDVKTLVDKGKDYGDSWKKRGGVGAFMMLARKWDRLEGQVQKEPKWDVFEHGAKDTRAEGILDDISDLRRYLLLVEAEIRNRRAVARSQQAPNLSYPGPVIAWGGGTAISPESVTLRSIGQANPFGFDPREDCRPTDLSHDGMSDLQTDCDGFRTGSD